MEISRHWPALPYEEWRATRDTLHAHTQVLGKLAVALAPAEPELQHAALRLTARGFETRPLPAPDGSGPFVGVVDVRSHEWVIEHSDGRVRRIALTPNRAVGEVTRKVLDTVADMVGAVHINPKPQEVSWTAPLDADEEHRIYDEAHVRRFVTAASQAALVLAEVRAPYRGRSTPVNAWWGSFDLAVALFSGRPAQPPSQDFITRNSADAEQVMVGWWPGSEQYPRAAFFAYAFPAPDDFSRSRVAPAAARWNAEMGEFLLDWDDVISGADPHDTALEFGRSVVIHACTVCRWDPALTASARGMARVSFSPARPPGA